MSNKRRGFDFERRVRRHLSEQGWFVVRSAGSFGAFDLIAIAPKEKVLQQLLLIGFTREQAEEALRVFSESVLGIQCKVNGKLSTTEKDRMLELVEEFPVTPVVFWRDGRRLRHAVVDR